MYCGIDQSLTSTGVWILDDEGNTKHHELIKTAKNKEDPSDLFNRIITITKRILSIVDEYNINNVCIEGLGFAANGDATRNLASLQGVIICSLMDTCDVHIEIVAPTTLKKFASGKGNCDKNAMVDSLPDEVRVIVDEVPKSKGKYDLADAYFLSKYLLERDSK